MAAALVDARALVDPSADGLTIMLKLLLAENPFEVASTKNVEVVLPLAGGGYPAITPVLVLSEYPVGKLPLVIE
jgi:hypothetical protein